MTGKGWYRDKTILLDYDQNAPPGDCINTAAGGELGLSKYKPWKRLSFGVLIIDGVSLKGITGFLRGHGMASSLKPCGKKDSCRPNKDNPVKVILGNGSFGATREWRQKAVIPDERPMDIFCKIRMSEKAVRLSLTSGLPEVGGQAVQEDKTFYQLLGSQNDMATIRLALESCDP